MDGSQAAKQRTVVAAAKQHSHVTAAKQHLVVAAAKQHSHVTAAKQHLVIAAVKQHSHVTAAKQHLVVAAAKQHSHVMAAKQHLVVAAVKQQTDNSQATRIAAAGRSSLHTSWQIVLTAVRSSTHRGREEQPADDLADLAGVQRRGGNDREVLKQLDLQVHAWQPALQMPGARTHTCTNTHTNGDCSGL